MYMCTVRLVHKYEYKLDKKCSNYKGNNILAASLALVKTANTPDRSTFIESVEIKTVSVMK